MMISDGEDDRFTDDEDEDEDEDEDTHPGSTDAVTGPPHQVWVAQKLLKT